ncbi:hypothetical protein [Paenibacillus sp. Z3-2]
MEYGENILEAARGKAKEETS